MIGAGTAMSVFLFGSFPVRLLVVTMKDTSIAARVSRDMPFGDVDHARLVSVYAARHVTRPKAAEFAAEVNVDHGDG